MDAGLIQQEILGELLEAGATGDEPMLERAEVLIDAKLAPLYAERGMTLDF